MWKRVAIVGGCAMAVAACGSTSNPSASSSTSNQPLEFANCMRSHGVPSFPDPSGRGQIAITPGSGINPKSPAFQAAQQACGKFAKGGGGPLQMSAGEHRAALRFAECMRGNGQPDFPDPTLTAPIGAARVLALRGMVFALPAGVDPKSPGFRRAASRCGVTPPGGAPTPAPG